MSEPKKYWVVCSLRKEITIEVLTTVLPGGARDETIPLKWVHGQVGALPVFDTHEAAEKFAGEPKGKYGIFQIQEVIDGNNDN